MSYVDISSRWPLYLRWQLLLRGALVVATPLLFVRHFLAVLAADTVTYDICIIVYNTYDCNCIYF